MTPVGAVTLDGSSPEIRPQDNLFGHVNGGWYETVEIPADLPVAGGFVTLMLEAESQVAEILRDAATAIAGGQAQPGSPRQQIGALFTSFMDEAAVEARGLSPLTEALALITSVECVGDFAEVLGQLERRGARGIFASYVDTDDRNSERYIVNIRQGGLGLPDESFYREDTFRPIRDAYREHLAAFVSTPGRRG